MKGDLPAAPSSRRRARRSAAETREHILATASAMFYADGIRSTGVDAVAAAAGVAPTTLYRLFASKDDLVAAYVERCAERYRAALTSAAGPDTGGPRERILAVFDAFALEVLSGSCRGCPFLMVLAEYPDPDSPVHAAAVAHKAWLRGLFHELVGELQGPAPGARQMLADQLALVAEGIYGSVQALGPTGPAAQGRVLAQSLLDAADGAGRESGPIHGSPRP